MKNVIISTSRMVKSIMLLAMLLLTYSAWGQQNWLPNHPRLLFTGAETFEVKELIKNEPLAGELALYLKAEADSIAEAPGVYDELHSFYLFLVYNSTCAAIMSQNFCPFSPSPLK